MNSKWSPAVHDVIRTMVAIGLFCIVLVAMSWNTRKATKVERANEQVLVCIALIPVDRKTAPNFQKCYDRVELDTGIQLKRYDKILEFEK